MEPIKCRTCGERHFLSEPHIFKDEPVFQVPMPKPVTQPATTMNRALNDVVNRSITPKHCPTCNCNKVYASAAERQKAYRQRKKDGG